MLRFLAFKSFRNRKFISSLCVISIALSLSLFFIVEKLRVGIEQGFTNSISNADLVVGARSGPMQLLLYSIFHMGSPTNNISVQTYDQIASNRAVEWTIPISLGDSYKGHRVVATDENFMKHYQFHGNQRLSFRSGEWGTGVFDVVIGSQVASRFAHSVGDSIVLSHGISETAIFDHSNTPFRVTGVLNTTGTPVDKAVYITLLGMEAIHVGWESGFPKDIAAGKHDSRFEDLTVSQLTAFILRTKNRIGLLGLQRYIGTFEQESLTAIIPAVVLTELWGLLDQLEKVFLAVSGFVIVIGFFTILISLYMSIDQRRRELAILRSVGVSAGKITSLLLMEAFLLSAAGALAGCLFQFLILNGLSPVVESRYAIKIPVSGVSVDDIKLLVLFVGLGTCFGLIPATKAYFSSKEGGLRLGS